MFASGSHWTWKTLSSTAKLILRTDSSKKTPVVRRAQIFHVALTFVGRNLDIRKDHI
ncbi:Transglutaminaselike, partial [Caligus rogercresseyi]